MNINPSRVTVGFHKMKPRIKYGILDGFGEVISWQWDRPSSNYKYVTKRIKPVSDIDWNNFEPALF